jgi:hypothetical protein
LTAIWLSVLIAWIVRGRQNDRFVHLEQHAEHLTSS